MREATALVERAALSVPGESEPVIAGFHRDGRLSLYFGADPVFQFDAEGRLRRAFCAGELYRSQGQSLARLRRERNERSTDLVRHDLDPQPLQRFLQEVQQRVQGLVSALERPTTSVTQFVSADPHTDEFAFLERLRRTLAATSSSALAPPVTLKR